MKQIEDTKTLDLLDAVPLKVAVPKRGRGRPAGPVPALTSAQRQAVRRARLKESGVMALTVSLSADVLAALSKFVEFKDMTKDQVVERILRDRLFRKR